ncbi:hypothetical protein DPMN_186161 [Dreissena polymorpha]|uniref:Uncharacterized protein n=1 Tax=Dreissena polymorpha TaxID=45954 RepID=A0A9D4DME4_DREPO|nr:hypothetical protein DPMN_186161 [Dreissena polymorpha]
MQIVTFCPEWWCGGGAVRWSSGNTLVYHYRGPRLKIPAGALEISGMLQVFPTQLEMYWYETQVILACIGAIH